MKIFVGLGNPGKEYENTYHNVGFLVLNESVRRILSVSPRLRYKNLFEYQEVKNDRDANGGAVFIWPMTFMNDSGKAVRAALKKFNANPADLVIFHDDSDITVGNYKTSFDRSSAGHKGVQSIIDAIKTKAFTRVRIGIRPVRETTRQKASEFALAQIKPRDKKSFDALFVAIGQSYFA